MNLENMFGTILTKDVR